MCSFENAGSKTLGSPFHSSSRFFLWWPTSCLPLCVKDEIPPLKDVLELSASHFKAPTSMTASRFYNVKKVKCTSKILTYVFVSFLFPLNKFSIPL